ncbi:MAG: hypothetical protein LBF58_06450 [Deltaproteobacteria bacterium]|jgi:hypothetical protein|nr:hypothetical protein [Deltaproteobacteria bacterium]
MARNDWLSGLLRTRGRRAARPKTAWDKSTRATGIGIPGALKPRNILTSVVTRSVNQVVRKVIGSLFRPK